MKRCLPTITGRCAVTLAARLRRCCVSSCSCCKSLGYGSLSCARADSGVRVEAGRIITRCNTAWFASNPTDGALSGATANMASGLYPDAETCSRASC